MTTYDEDIRVLYRIIYHASRITDPKGHGGLVTEGSHDIHRIVWNHTLYSLFRGLKMRKNSNA